MKYPMLGVLVISMALAGCGTDEARTGADSAQESALEVRQAWTRAIPPNAPVAAGYLSIANGTPDDDRLLEVRLDAAERAEIHEMQSTPEGTLRMRELTEGLSVPSGASVDLRPGGLHLMFMRPQADRWQVGESLNATLVFEVAGEREVQFEVYAPGQSPEEAGVQLSAEESPFARERHEHDDHPDAAAEK